MIGKSSGACVFRDWRGRNIAARAKPLKELSSVEHVFLGIAKFLKIPILAKGRLKREMSVFFFPNNFPIQRKG